jgi:formylglycine-generating enzyme required for sulfatase activity
MKKIHRVLQFLLVIGCILSGCLGLSVSSFAQGVQPGNNAELARRLIVKVNAENNFGAGIIFSVKGDFLFIATAYHVVQAGVKDVEFEFLRGVPVPAELINSYDKLDLAVLRINVRESSLRNAPNTLLPFDLLAAANELKRGDEVYPIGHPEGEDWDIPIEPAKIKKVIAEEIQFQPACFQGHSGGGLFNAQWQLVGMMTRTKGTACEAVSFARIRATLEDDWGLTVNRQPTEIPGALAVVQPTPIPTVAPTPQPTVTPIPPPTATPTVKPTATPPLLPEPTVTPTPMVTSTPTPTETPTITPTPALYPLVIVTSPGDASIKIMNIKPRFEQGIKLPPGKYDIEVSRPGYQTQRFWTEIINKAITVEVELFPLKSLTPTPQPTVTPTPTPIPPVAGQLWHDEVSGIDFAWVPPGKFMMGQTEAEKRWLTKKVEEEGYKRWYVNELPCHEVQITEGFWMSKYEVTQERWLAVMGGKSPALFNEEKVGKGWRNHPVEQVSWNNIQEFLKNLNTKAGKAIYRLPSEAEWEYAARAGAETMFAFGDEVNTLGEYAWYSKNSDRKTHPVGQFEANDWGLYDMHGNVWEWCADVWHENYTGAPTDGSVWEKGGDASYRTLRGGAWDNDPQNVRCAVRNRYVSDDGGYSVGFRVVVVASAWTLR